MATTFKIIGFTDSVNECDCCGKTELKGTYCMESENGDEFYFGSVCGARAAGITTKTLSSTVKEIELLAEVDIMAKDANYEYAKNKIIKFIEKKKLNVLEFVKKNGVVIEDALYYTAYGYGSKVFTEYK